MNQIAQLIEIPLPPAISWWPLAPGWYLVLLLAIVIITVIIVAKLKRWQANRYRRAALAQLTAVDIDNAACLNQIIRQTVMDAGVIDKLNETGSRWLQFLNHSCQQPVFEKKQLQRLEQLNYQALTSATERLSDMEFQQLKALCLRWVREHRFEY